MDSPFFDISKNIANDFLQNIVFVDDEAFAKEGDRDHDFNPFAMTKVFAKSQKICSIYNPVKESEIDDLINISAKADIVVLDWKIDLQNDNQTQVNDEEDEEDDFRGKYSLQLIKGILAKERNSLKLFVVYTGETDLWQITDAIHASLGADDVEFEKGHFEVKKGNVKVCVIGKTSIQAKHTTEIQERIKSYEDLPEFLLVEFTKMTAGLLSNAAIKGLTEIRKKAYQLITTFQPSIDPAFLSHRALLPNPQDSEEQFLDILGSEIKSVLKGVDAHNYLSKSDIKLYIEWSLEDKAYPFSIPLQENFQTVSIPSEIDRNLVYKFTEVGIENVFLKKDTPTNERILFTNNCYQKLTNYYSSSEEEAIESDKQFALLTSVKSNYHSNLSPLLTQGTILYKRSDQTYWICIQPKCDTVRIEGNRDFLFLPLKVVTAHDKFDFLLKIGNEYLYFKVVSTVYKSQFFAFKADANREIRGVFENGLIIMKKGTTQPPLVWLGELKSDFAQSIANEFAANLSRVGMDHSEWLRRSS
jgi:hypothetical protein